MWLIQLHKLETKDYNYSKRALEKMGYYPRKVPSIVFIKALFYHVLQKKSWRSIGKLLNSNYLSLYNFYHEYQNHPDLEKIFHHFAERGIIVYIGQNKTFKVEKILDNKSFTITKREIKRIFESYRVK